MTVGQKFGDYRYKADVKGVWCEFGWKIAACSTVVLNDCVDRSPYGAYICFIARKVMKVFLLGLPFKVVDKVPLLFVFYKFLLLPRFVSE